jgi:hypothetical protein
MPAPRILREIHDQLVAREGEPDGSIGFENGPPGAPERVDVFVWEAQDVDDVTLLQNVGMDAVPMEGDRRCELRWVIRGILEETDVSTCATFLANVALYPFLRHTYFDWWQTLRQPVPLFKSSAACWFHPPFAGGGLEGFETSVGYVRLLHLVPLTEAEAAMSTRELREHFERSGIDIFTPR